MKIQINENGMSTGQIVKFVGTGYFFGGLLLFGIPAIFIFPLSFLSENPEEKFEALVFFFAVPIILAMQGLMFSLLVAAGHWLFKKFKPIEFELPANKVNQSGTSQSDAPV